MVEPIEPVEGSSKSREAREKQYALALAAMLDAGSTFSAPPWTPLPISLLLNANFNQSTVDNTERTMEEHKERTKRDIQLSHKVRMLLQDKQKNLSNRNVEKVVKKDHS